AERSNSPQPRVDRRRHVATAEHEVPQAAAHLPPQHRGAQGCEEQGADFGDHPGLAEVVRIALHHHPRAQGTDGVGVQAAVTVERRGLTLTASRVTRLAATSVWAQPERSASSASRWLRAGTSPTTASSRTKRLSIGSTASACLPMASSLWRLAR